jgi:hypothetical protein
MSDGSKGAPKTPARKKREPSPPQPWKPAPSRFDERDPLGRMALFSEIEPQEPGNQPLWIECSSCLKETPVSALDLVRATLPFSLHLPLVKRYHSYMRCPACGRRTWVRVRLRPV